MKTLCNPVFRVGGKSFPINVDYKVEVHEARRSALQHVRWWGNIELDGRVFPYAEMGRQEFICRYATLLANSRFGTIEEAFSANGLFPADMMQLFAFVSRYARTEVTTNDPHPIVAAAPGSVWKCSHGILPEMAGVSWSSFHHAPGPDLSTVFEDPHRGFEEGTRFLIIE
jgi:hypothetical protein